MCVDRRLRERGGKKSIVEYFDFVAGTSTGAILALALAKGTVPYPVVALLVSSQSHTTPLP